MIVLHHSGGASDFSIVGLGGSHDEFQRLRHNVIRLLRSREQQIAAGMLESVAFEPLEATNHFGDEFSILHATVPLPEYERLRLQQQHSDYSASFSQVAAAFRELGFHVRIIAVDLQMETGSTSDVSTVNDDSTRRLTRSADKGSRAIL